MSLVNSFSDYNDSDFEEDYAAQVHTSSEEDGGESLNPRVHEPRELVELLLEIEVPTMTPSLAEAFRATDSPYLEELLYHIVMPVEGRGALASNESSEDENSQPTPTSIPEPEESGKSSKKSPKLGLEWYSPKWQWAGPTAQAAASVESGLLTTEQLGETIKKLKGIVDEGAEAAWHKENASVLYSDRRNIDPALLKRAYKVVKLLVEDSHLTSGLLQSRCQLVVDHMFRVFTPSARGSFYHAAMVLQRLIMLIPDKVLPIIRNRSRKYLASLLHYLHEDPTPDLVCQIITVNFKSTAAGGAGSGVGGGLGLGMGMGFDTYDSFDELKIEPLFKRYGVQPEPKNKQDFLWDISQWNFMLLMASHVYRPEYRSNHISGAADAMLYIVERLAGDTQGGIVLMPLGHTPEVLRGLIAAACDDHKYFGDADSKEDEKADDSAPKGRSMLDETGYLVEDRYFHPLRVIQRVTFLSCSDSLPSLSDGIPGMAPEMSRDNNLQDIRDLWMNTVLKNLPSVCDATLRVSEQLHQHCPLPGVTNRRKKRRNRKNKKAKAASSPAKADSKADEASTPSRKNSNATDGDTPSRSEPASPNPKRLAFIKYPGHSVRVPFGRYRLTAVQLVADLAENRPKRALHALSGEWWESLMAWFLEYPHNNMYHLAMKRIIISACLHPTETLLSTLLERSGIISCLMKLLPDDPAPAEVPSAKVLRKNDMTASKSKSEPDAVGEEALSASLAESSLSPKKDTDTGVPKAASSEATPEDVDMESSATGPDSLPQDSPNGSAATTPAKSAGSTTSTPAKGSKSSVKRPAPSSIGTALDLLNCFRLAAEKWSKATYLQTYLKNHSLWDSNMDKLKRLTYLRARPLGEGPRAFSYFSDFSARSAPSLEDEVNIDLGSEFARNLGFEPGETEDEDEEMGGSNLPGDLSSELSEDDFEM